MEYTNFNTRVQRITALQWDGTGASMDALIEKGALGDHTFRSAQLNVGADSAASLYLNFATPDNREYQVGMATDDYLYISPSSNRYTTATEAALNENGYFVDDQAMRLTN